MKRIIIIFIMTLLASLLFAETPGTLLESSLVTVNTYVPHYCLVTLSPITATSESDTTGMPFDITGSDVADSGTGRKIATWSIEANMASFSITFDAEPLTSADSITMLGYILTFKYNDNSSLTLTVSSSGETSVTGAPTTGPLVSLDKDILFKFDSTSTSAIASAEDGSYYSSLTITLTEN